MVAPREVPLVTQEDINHMDPTITIVTHKIYTQIEDKPLPWYLVNVVVDPGTGEIPQYKDLMQPKEEKQEKSGKTDYQNNLDDL